MFKKRAKKPATRHIRTKEDSSEEEVSVISPISSISAKDRSQQNHTASTLPSIVDDNSDDQLLIEAPKVPIFIKSRSRTTNIKASLFTSGRPKFTTKIDLSRETESFESTDGLDSLMPKEVILNGDEIKKLQKEQMIETDSSEEDSDTKRFVEKAKIMRHQRQLAEEKKDEFIALPSSKSLRASLHQRNTLSSSDSAEDILPSYDMNDEDEIATTGYTSSKDQFRSKAPKSKKTIKKSIDSEYKINRLDQNDLNPSAITAPTPLWEADDVSASSSDEEARWEKQLIERGNAGPKNIAKMTDSAQNLGPEPVFSVVSEEHVIRRLTSALNDLRIEHDEDTQMTARLEKEIEQIEEEERKEFMEKKEMETRYDYYQKEYDYFRRLSGCLTDRRNEIEDLYTQYCRIRQQYKANNDVINKLYVKDDAIFLNELECVVTVLKDLPVIPDINSIRDSTGPFFKSEIYYDEHITQARNQDRCTYSESPAVIRDTIHEIPFDNHIIHVITADADTYLNNVMYYGYDDDSAGKYISCLREIRQKIDNVYNDSDRNYMKFDVILSHFDYWRRQFQLDYENAYISLSVHEFLIPVVIPSLLYFDPLGIMSDDNELNTGWFSSIHELPWFSLLKEFCENSPVSRDAAILPRLVQKCIVSYINDIILYDWNPMSSREAEAVYVMLTELASFFTTVTDELRAVYVNVSKRIYEAVESGLCCIVNLYSEKSGDILIDAQEISEIYLTRNIRLLEVVNKLACFMDLGTPAPLIDSIVDCLCSILGGICKIPCLIPKCQMFAQRERNCLVL